MTNENATIFIHCQQKFHLRMLSENIFFQKLSFRERVNSQPLYTCYVSSFSLTTELPRTTEFENQEWNCLVSYQAHPDSPNLTLNHYSLDVQTFNKHHQPLFPNLMTRSVQAMWIVWLASNREHKGVYCEWCLLFFRKHPVCLLVNHIFEGSGWKVSISMYHSGLYVALFFAVNSQI